MPIPTNCIFGENIAHNTFVVLVVRGAVISAIVKQRRVAVSVTITKVAIPISVAGVGRRVGIGGRIRVIFIGSVWIGVPARPRTPPPWYAGVADKDDFIGPVEATKPFISTKVAVIEMVKASKAQG
jgi:hypothetical protein